MAILADRPELSVLLANAGNIVALTGAGLSTAAGIPDFRGPQGIYATRRYDPEKTFEIDWFQREPRFFYEFAADFTALLGTIRPTCAHDVLARLETAGLLRTVITQNIDMLHQLAGSRQVIELHGSPASATCIACGHRLAPLAVTWWLEAIAASPKTPVVLCPACDGVLKPDIVFYGEPVHRYGEAEQAVADCDLLLVLGTSLSVHPAAWLPAATSAPVIVVTQGEVDNHPPGCSHVVHAELDAFCREMEACLGVPGQPGLPGEAEG